MAVEFKDAWLALFYEDDKHHKKIPSAIKTVLFRKIQMLDVAAHEDDLRIPPGNQFEHLIGNLIAWCSIRVNQQYRLIFRCSEGVAVDTYLDPHSYKNR